ncbi:MAG: Mut7-C ubiquitin/RNAse domain-containing protein [Anaerolineales bacterium]|nr:Mut7-C ubiquitin/RNAse domain-containing protein [Anaerolineales bacterium]
MNTATFAFGGDLDFFLERDRRGRVFPLTFAPHQSIKHLIEALGVPHVEVGLVLANGVPVEAGYRPRKDDRIEIRPVSPGWEGEVHFLLDIHLGRLAAHLRMLGFDCLYRNDYRDEEMADLLRVERRILLSRDRQLLMRKVVAAGYCPRSLSPEQQLVEVVRRFDLARRARPFTRCMRCNGLLVSVEKAAVLDRLEPLTRDYFDTFASCTDCNQVYWKGSHWERMRAVIKELALSEN